MKIGLGVTARHDAVAIKAGVNAVAGDGAKSTGINAQLSVAFRF